MKKTFLLLGLFLAVCSFPAAAQKVGADNGHGRFKKAKSGLLYRYETKNRRAPQPKVGDVLVGEMTMQFDTLTIFTNEGRPERIFHVAESAFPGDINEGLLMMHKGDKMSFAIPADSVAARVGERRMPPSFRQGEGQTIYYTVALHDILSPEQIAREQDSLRTMLETRKKEEGKILADYVQSHYKNGLEMTMSGLYIVVKKKGDGALVVPGRRVRAEYTGRLLDGTVFDSGTVDYVVAQTRLIEGWEQGVHGQPAGTELTILVPSSMAYGERGAGKDILPYTSLIFDIKILEVTEE